MSQMDPGAQDADATTGFPDRGPTVFIVTTTTLSLATLFVAARMVSRVGILRRTGWDDYMVVVAWLIAVFLSLSIDLGTKSGLGRHDRDIDLKKLPELRVCEYVFSILYNPALMATKTSILIFYLRLSKNTQMVLRLASWAVLGIVNVAGTILTFMNIFQCVPIPAAWDMTVPFVRCIPLLTEFICAAPVNITTDLAILALPIPVLTGMRLPSRQKTILIMTFGLGIFVTIVDVIRIFYLQQALNHIPLSPSDLLSVYGHSAGFSWNASFALMWSAVEVNVGIICACIPTLKPLIIRILPAMLVDPHGTLRSSTRTGGSSSSNNPTTKDDRRTSTGTAALTIPAASHLSPGEDNELDDLEISPSTLGPISIRDFLSSHPDPTLPLPKETAAPPVPVPVPEKKGTYFGFVNLPPPQSLLHLTSCKALRYCTAVTILFFLWGFSYGLLNTLNNAVAAVTGMSTAQTLGLTSVYWGAGYFLGPLVVGGGGLEGIGGFKATFIVGLLIYGAGTIMFWPGAVLGAYGGFMVCGFVVGFGLAVLETAANPFLVLCGPVEHADARLLLAQGVQAVASVLSGVLADRVFFFFGGSSTEDEKLDSTTLIDVQWTYLAVTLLSVLLALFFFYMPLPEVADAELAELAARLPVDPKRRLAGGISLRTWTVGLAVLCQWCYVAAQENMSLFFQQLVTAFGAHHHPGGPSKHNGAALAITLPNYLQVSHSVFALSRFLAGGLCILSTRHASNPFLPTPRMILTLSIALSTLSVITAVVLPTSTDPNVAVIPIILFYFFEGPIWPLTFSLGMRGQGERTKRAAAWLTMGGSGPGAWPFVSYGIMQAGGSVQLAMIVVVVLLAVAAVFPAFLGLVKGARELADVPPSAEGGENRRQDTKASEGDVEMGAEKGGKSANREGGLLGQQLRPGWPGSRASLSLDPDQSQPSQHQAPWESQVLDTRILQD
ncbi:L-fucose-proton symporter [Chaetomidium leptoderma]|uniref:L-fucose-proton symporter n=1 Tax=Chaetomidium leptoderma TaxID=669021 RepID=A0AAN6VWE7_9PEZI|nr:L-fucose-proton symporter [Chaetomidium leptoderma]